MMKPLDNIWKIKSGGNLIPPDFKLLAVFSIFFLLSSVACTEEPPPVLNYKEREVIDSLFRVYVEATRPQLDSLCNVRHDSAVQHNVDSMMEVRLGEIERYLEKIKQENIQ